MNIEEIKKRISNLTNDGIWFSMHTEDLMGSCGYDEPDSLGWVKGGKTDVGQNIDFVVNAKKDIEYLLSIIEQAEKALDNIVNYDDGIIRINDEIAQLADIYEDIAKAALKAIRGN